MPAKQRIPINAIPANSVYRAGILLALSVAMTAFSVSETIGQERFQRRRFTLNRFEEGGRSITQVRRLMPDQRRLPRSFQRQTHRGWEIRTPQYEIIAPNKMLAEAAAAEFERGWAATNRIATGLGRDTKAFGFAQRSVVVFFDSEQKANARASRQWANQDQYVIQVRGDYQSNHAHAIRAAASRSFLSASEWDRELPTWFEIGLGEWVASQTGSVDSTEQGGNSLDIISAPDEFRSARAVSRQTQNNDAAANRALVTWWLEEDGGRNAWQVLAALRDRPNAKTRLDNLRASLPSPFSTSNLLVREPHVALVGVQEQADRGLQLQNDLYVMLRLIERERLTARRTTPTVQTRVAVREFKDGQTTSREAPNTDKVEAGDDSAMWQRRLQTALSRPNWSVLSLDGDWVESDSAERLAGRLAQQPTIRFEKNRWTLTYPAASGNLVAVWERPSSPNSSIQFAVQ